MVLTDGTGILSRHVLDLDAAAIPPGVVACARRVLADTVGVLFGAMDRPAVLAALTAFPLSTGPCTVVGHGRGASPDLASLINGIGAHDIELDDGFFAVGHAAAVIVPAVIAAAEVQDGCTIGDLVIALVGAYDVEGRVSRAMGGTTALHDRGFHSSAVCGSIGGAVGAGRILQLTEQQLRCSIGLAASQSSGLSTYRDDPTHMSKSFQTGVAARNGVTAALLAKAGYQSAPDVLTGAHDLLRPFGGDAVDPGELIAEVGHRFEVSLTSLKRHASCLQTHSAVDALIAVMRTHQLSTSQVVGIDVQLAHKAVARVDGNPLWTHNIQYVMALAATVGQVAPEHFTRRWTDDPAISRLAEAVTVRGNDDLQARFPEQRGAIVTVLTASEQIVDECAEAIGSPGRPMSDQAIWDKFQHLTSPALEPTVTRWVWDTLLEGDLDADAEPILGVLGRRRKYPTTAGGATDVEMAR